MDLYIYIREERVFMMGSFLTHISHKSFHDAFVSLVKIKEGFNTDIDFFPSDKL